MRSASVRCRTRSGSVRVDSAEDVTAGGGEIVGIAMSMVWKSMKCIVVDWLLVILGVLLSITVMKILMMS